MDLYVEMKVTVPDTCAELHGLEELSEPIGNALADGRYDVIRISAETVQRSAGKPELTLREMLASADYQAWWIERKHEIAISDHEFADRLYAYAEEGLDGCTHAEVIDGWFEYVRELVYLGKITDVTAGALDEEIEAARQWHMKNGTLDRCCE